MELTATPSTSPKFMSAEYFRKSVDESNAISGTVTGAGAAATPEPQVVGLSRPNRELRNAALIDHWDFGTARSEVRDGHYDVVILQQGSSSLPENRDSLRLWTRMWAPEIRKAGGRPALYAVWPEKARMYAFPDVSESYRLAAEDVDGLFMPVGDTWLETWNIHPDAQLYGGDEFHPQSPAPMQRRSSSSRCCPIAAH